MGNGSKAVRVLSVAVLVAVTAVALAACESGGRNAAGTPGNSAKPVAEKVAQTAPTSEMTHYENLEYSVSDLLEATELADYFRIPEAATSRRIKPESLEFFRNAETARRWLGEGYHRAITVGHPSKTCPFFYASWKAASVEKALYQALYRCLSYVKEVDNLTGGNCGCRVIALDDSLFGPAEGFQYRSLLPTMLMRAPAGTDEYTLKSTGFLEFAGHLGKDQPIRLLDGKGDPLCSGTYTSGKPGKGVLKFECGDEPGPFEGAYRVLGFYAGRAFGLAVARSGHAELIALFGLTEKNFSERWREIEKKKKY